MSGEPRSSKFTSLPTEVKEAILHACPDFTTLRSLARTCRVMHDLYAHSRKSILSAVLRRSLQLPILVDAVAIVVAAEERKKVFDKVKSPCTAFEDFLHKYHPLRKILNPHETVFDSEYMREEPNVYDLFGGLSQSSIDGMVELHCKVEVLVSNMVQSMVQLRPKTNTEEPSTQSVHISNSESVRMIRALYRLEIFHIVFEDMRLVETVEGEIRAERFLQIYSPWEMEELKCARKYLMRLYTPLPGASRFDDDFEEITGHRPKNYPPRHIMEIELIQDEWRFEINDDTRAFCVAKGLDHAYKWLRTCQIPCPAERFIQQREIVHGNIMSENFDVLCAFETDPLEEYIMKFSIDQPEQAAFVSDENWNNPSLAWCWCVDKSHVYGHSVLYAVRINPLCHWGYVFWDQCRFAEWGYDERLLREEMERRPLSPDEEVEWSISY